MQAGPIAVGGVLYVSTYRSLAALREADGAPLWEYAASNLGAPASDGSRVWASYACGWLRRRHRDPRAGRGTAARCNADNVGPRHRGGRRGGRAADRRA